MTTRSAEIVPRLLDDVPPLSQVVAELQQALAADDVSLDDIAERVSHDPALAMKTLRLANCSFFGVPARVGTIRAAIGILGLRTVSMLVTTAAIADAYRGQPARAFDAASFWRHSMGTAVAAREIAKVSGVAEDVAFTAGLLHDVGRMAMAFQLPEDYDRVARRRGEDDGPWIDAERTVLGCDHAENGAEILRRWRFSTGIVEGVRDLHAPVGGAGGRLADVLHVADAMAHALDLAMDEHELVPMIDSSSWTRLGLSAEQVLAICDATEIQVRGLCSALGV